MAGILFRLEAADGTPAEPPSLSSAVPNWSAGDTIPFGVRLCAWSTFETTTPINHPCWSSRTWLKERLARQADVS